MCSKLATNRQHFTMVTPHETKALHPYAMYYSSYDDGTTALILSLTGVALMVVTTVSMLVAFRVL